MEYESIKQIVECQLSPSVHVTTLENARERVAAKQFFEIWPIDRTKMAKEIKIEGMALDVASGLYLEACLAKRDAFIKDSVISTIPFKGFGDAGFKINDLINEYSDNHGEKAERIIDLISECRDNSKLRLHLANVYAALYSVALRDKVGGLPLPTLMLFESFSPQNDNYTGDRIFVHLAKKAITRLRKCVSAESLNKLIAAKFTSYDGFHSFYPNSLKVWDEKPMAEWDHNQLGTLLECCLNASQFGQSFESHWPNEPCITEERFTVDSVDQEKNKELLNLLSEMNSCV